MLDRSPEKIPRRDRRKAESKQRIYEAALSLFRNQGYESTTIQDICDIADTARQTFFNYFPGKEHVLVEYHRRLIQGIFDRISELSPRSQTDAILSALKIFAAGAEKSVSLSRTILRHVFHSDVLETVDRENEEKIFSWFQARLIQAIRNGELASGLNAPLLTSIVMSVLSSTVQEWLVSAGKFDLEEELIRRIKFILRLASVRVAPAASRRKKR